MKNNYSRRLFLKTTIGTGVTLAGTMLPELNASPSQIKNPYDPKGLPTTVLGKTGVVVPRLAIGLGSRFCNIVILDEALEMLTFALDNGLYYWDMANSYVNNSTGVISEERLGHIIKNRRKEIFLSTKLASRDPDKAKQQMEESLKRLQTDHVDMLKIHSVDSLDDVNNICKKGGVLDVVTKYKEQGVTRFIGFSGHGVAAALKAMVDTGRFDSMLFAMNQWADNKEDRQGLIIPAAINRGMGIMIMKTVRPKDTIKDLDPRELIRFALSLKGPNGFAVGMDSKKVVESNLNLLRNFVAMDENEKIRFALTLSPFFRHENLEWMKADYRDGYWG